MTRSGLTDFRYLVLWTEPCYKISQVDYGSCYHVLSYIMSSNNSILLSFLFTINVYNYCIHLMNMYVHNVYALIIIRRHSPIHHTNNSLHLYANNHNIYNVYICIYVCFIVYFMITKINLMLTAICYDHAKCLQHSKMLTHIIIRTFHPFGSCYLILKIINTLPIYIYIIYLIFFEVILYFIIWAQNVIPFICQMIFAIIYCITQTISSYITHVYYMDIFYTLYVWIICMSPFHSNTIANNCMLIYFIISQNYLVSCPSYICIYLLCVSLFVYRFEEEKSCWEDKIDFYTSYYPP